MNHKIYNFSNQKPENNNFVGNKHFATIDRKIQSNQTHREKENELVLQSQQLEKNKSLTSMKSKLS